MHTWHWISSAVCLVGMLLFAITGITLNHAAAIESKAERVTWRGALPDALRESLAGQAATTSGAGAFPDALRDWLRMQDMWVPEAGATQWSADEIYWSRASAGADAWVNVDLATGDVEAETSDRGWIAFFNDLHKGRNTGTAWSWFIDVFAVACLLFCITGLVLLKLHAGHRAATWPIVLAGLVLPLLLIVFFLH